MNENRDIIVEKSGMVFSDFDIRCFDGVKENLGDNPKDKFKEIKGFVDETLGSKWEIGENKLKVHLFCDEKQYKDYLAQNFPNAPRGWATFDKKTNSILKCAFAPKAKEGKIIFQSGVFAGVGHEMAHLHPFFGGVGNKASKGKWKQEMICVFIEDKIRTIMGNTKSQDINMEKAQEEIKKLKEEGKRFSLEKTDQNWKDFSAAERFVYPWLEQKYGIKKLRNLWQQLFTEKKPLPDAVKNIYGTELADLENEFEEYVLKAKEPHFDKIVGLPEEYRTRQKEIEEILSQKLKGVGGKKIEKFETDKTERDIEIINFAKDTISEYTRKYTRKKYNIPLQNIHVFNSGGTEEFTEGRFKTGATSTKYGDIVVDRIKSDATFAMVLFHEILHLNSYTALQVKTGKEPSIEVYRSGVEIKTRNGEKILFKDISEAVTELIAQRFYQEKIIPSQIFEEEDKKNFLPGRIEEVAKLETLIDVLWERNKDRFKIREDIEDLFFESQFTGDLLKLGRLIEKTFGKGSFRKLGEGNLIKK